MLESVQAVQPVGQVVQLVALVSEKVPVAQAAHASVPPAENSLATQATQVLELSPHPAVQVWQVLASVQVAQPLGQVVQEVALAAENSPSAQVEQAAEPPAENCPGVQAWQALPFSPHPAVQVWQVLESVQVAQPLGQEVHEVA